MDESLPRKQSYLTGYKRLRLGSASWGPMIKGDLNWDTQERKDDRGVNL